VHFFCLYILPSSYSLFLFLMSLPPLISTLFPYTTLFRSEGNNLAFRCLDFVQDGLQAFFKFTTVFRTRNHGTEVQRQQRLSLKRSEEHTSELQSRFDLVCRLLLEKKKKNKKTQSSNTQLN